VPWIKLCEIVSDFYAHPVRRLLNGSIAIKIAKGFREV